MPPGEQKLGFLAAGRAPALGYVGGYLLTTARGRPLEFHYTVPVKPSATHRILYGAELDAYIFEELIGTSLIRQSMIEPAFLITDQPLILNQRPQSSCPIICVIAAPPTTDGTAAIEGASEELRSHSDFPQDREALDRWMLETRPGLDLHEPFVRIWEALHEVLSTETKQAA